jgi:hypothetical protein
MAVQEYAQRHFGTGRPTSAQIESELVDLGKMKL